MDCFNSVKQPINAADPRAEEASPVKSLVAELAGKLKDHALPVPRNEERKLVLSSPPCSLQLHNQPDGESEKEKPAVAPPTPAKPKLKNSPFVEKLQANLALTPKALLPSAKSPELKQQTVPFFPISPCGPQSPTLRPPQQPDDNEVPVSFEQPPEGNLLSSFNKSRVRLSFKRRPPTRQHRKSADVTPDTHDGDTSSCDRHSVEDSPDKNGDGDAEEVLCSPLEEAEEQLKDSTHTVTEQDTEQQEGRKDKTQDNQENTASEGEKGELEREDGSDQSETSEPVEIQHEEKPCAQESSEEMEGLEKEGSTPMEENDKQQVQASAD